jgi:hypothetical protein
LKQAAKSLGRKKGEWKLKIEELLLERLTCHDSDNDISLNPNERNRSETQTAILYNLCGYLVLKAGKLVKCHACVSNLKHNSQEVPPEALLTSLLDNGGLIYPSQAFFQLISEWVEPAILEVIEGKALYGDIITRIVLQINHCPIINSIGCQEEGHNLSLLLKIIPYYIVMRLNFYSRNVRNSLGHGKATKNKRKESKLVSS